MYCILSVCISHWSCEVLEGLNSILSFRHLEHCLFHNKISIYFCWMIEWMRHEKNWIYFLGKITTLLLWELSKYCQRINSLLHVILHQIFMMTSFSNDVLYVPVATEVIMNAFFLLNKGLKIIYCLTSSPINDDLYPWVFFR